MNREDIVRKLTDEYTAAYSRYRIAVLRQEKPCSKAEIAKVKRQENDLKNGVKGFVFDMKKGLRQRRLGISNLSPQHADELL